MPARFLLPLIDQKAASGFVNASLALDQARAVKDIQEQELMRKASHLNDMAMAEITHFFKEGVTETDLAEQRVSGIFWNWREVIVRICLTLYLKNQHRLFRVIYAVK